MGSDSSLGFGQMGFGAFFLEFEYALDSVVRCGGGQVVSGNCGFVLFVMLQIVLLCRLVDCKRRLL